MKRSNGLGSVYRLSGKRRNPWAAAITMGWDPAGKQVRRIIGYYPDRPSAEQAIAQYRCGAIGEYADVTLAELYEMYKHDRAFTELSRQTQDNYEAVYKY